MINIEDLTENEIVLLKMTFKSVEEIIEIQRYYHCCSVDLCNDLFNLKEKLGIYDLVS